MTNNLGSPLYRGAVPGNYADVNRPRIDPNLKSYNPGQNVDFKFNFANRRDEYGRLTDEQGNALYEWEAPTYQSAMAKQYSNESKNKPMTGVVNQDDFIPKEQWQQRGFDSFNWDNIHSPEIDELKTRLDNLENEKADIEKRIPQLEAALEDMKRSQADRLAENRMGRWRKDNTGMDQWNKNRDRETEIELRNITDTRTLRNNLTKSLDDIDANIAYWNQQKVAGDSATKAAADAELVRLNERKKSLLKLGKDKGLDLSEYYSGGSSEPETPTAPNQTTVAAEPEDIFKGKSEWEIANTAAEGQTEANVQRIAAAKKEIERLEGDARKNKTLSPELKQMGYTSESYKVDVNKGKTDEYGFALKPKYETRYRIVKPNGEVL